MLDISNSFISQSRTFISHLGCLWHMNQEELHFACAFTNFFTHNHSELVCLLCVFRQVKFFSLCRHLPEKIKDDQQLKNMSGQWFYEAKAKRHKDKIHGADIIRASMRRKRLPAAGEVTADICLGRRVGKGMRLFTENLLKEINCGYALHSAYPSQSKSSCLEFGWMKVGLSAWLQRKTIVWVPLYNVVALVPGDYVHAFLQLCVCEYVCEHAHSMCTCHCKHVHAQVCETRFHIQ